MQPSIDAWIKENLRYDPETGYLWWTKRGRGRFFDKPVGSVKQGYIRVHHRYGGLMLKHYAHRLAWFFYYGVWPKNQIDHINSIRDDNRIVNLREATRTENNRNANPREGGSSKYKGVSWNKHRCKWVVRIGSGEKSYLGSYDTEQEAALTYNKAALNRFGEFAKINVIEPLDMDMTNTYINSSSGELTC
jgi:hypothetical protein